MRPEQSAAMAVISLSQDMTTQQSIDQAKSDAFLGKVLTDTSGMTVTVMAGIGDRLGLFKELAHGSASSVELATRTGLNERYVREWLGAMVSASYVEYNPVNGRFTLPPEHIPVLAQESGPFFFMLSVLASIRQSGDGVCRQFAHICWQRCVCHNRYYGV